MSNQNLHKFFYLSPARKRSAVFKISLTAEHGYQVKAFSMVNQTLTPIETRSVENMKAALEIVCELADPFIKKKNYSLIDGADCPRQLLADMATSGAVVAPAPAPAAPGPMAIAYGPRSFVGGGVMVPVWF